MINPSQIFIPSVRTFISDTFPADISPRTVSSPEHFPSSPRTFSRLLKWNFENWLYPVLLTLTDPRGADFFVKTATVHVDCRSVYITDRRIVVVERKKCPTACKKRGEIVQGGLSVEFVRRNMSRVVRILLYFFFFSFLATILWWNKDVYLLVTSPHRDDRRVLFSMVRSLRVFHS